MQWESDKISYRLDRGIQKKNTKIISIVNNIFLDHVVKLRGDKINIEPRYDPEIIIRDS